MEKAETLILLGDVTDSKDFHPSELVNRVVWEIDTLRKAVPRIVILMGNHDVLKHGSMFFKFLSALPGVDVIDKPTEDMDGEVAAMFLPYSRNPNAEWKSFDLSHFNYVFMHQTIKGAYASNGQQMDGEQLPSLDAAGKIYSGDIHVPQVVGPIEYVGSPYHVHFGDAFTPRCVAIDRDRRAFDLSFPSISRVTIDATADDWLEKVRDMRRGDQLKLRVHLGEDEKHQWRTIRSMVKVVTDEAGIELCGLELKVEKQRERYRINMEPHPTTNPEETLYRFVQADGLGGLLETGLECL